MNGIGKVGRDKIRLNEPFGRIPQVFAFAVAGANKDTARAHTVRKFDISAAVADDKGSLKVDGVFLRRLQEHAGSRLPAFATIGRGVRAIVNCLQMRALGAELLGQQFVDRMHERFREVSPSNARLICYQNDRQAGFIQAPNGFGHAGQDTKSADVIQVADLFGDGTVAIKKNGGANGGGVRQGAPPLLKSTVSRRPQLRQARRESCICDPSGSVSENMGCNRASPARWCSAA